MERLRIMLISGDRFVSLSLMNESCGLQTAKTILEQRAVPIMLTTTFIAPELVDQADALGVAGYVVKPLS